MLKPLYLECFQQNAKFKETQKTPFVNTTVLIALVKMSVFFSAFIIFVIFAIFFSEMFLIGFQKSKNNEIPKQNKDNKNNNKITKCKTKTSQIL